MKNSQIDNFINDEIAYQIIDSFSDIIDFNIKKAYSNDFKIETALKRIKKIHETFNLIRNDFECKVPDKLFESFIFFKSGKKSIWFLDKLNIKPDFKIVDILKQTTKENIDESRITRE